jgi:hypothetical protein
VRHHAVNTNVVALDPVRNGGREANESGALDPVRNGGREANESGFAPGRLADFGGRDCPQNAVHKRR